MLAGFGAARPRARNRAGDRRPRRCRSQPECQQPSNWFESAAGAIGDLDRTARRRRVKICPSRQTTRIDVRQAAFPVDRLGSGREAIPMPQFSIRLPETSLTVTPEQFEAIAAENPDLRLERTASGKLIVNPPTGSESSKRNVSITAQLYCPAVELGCDSPGFGGCLRVIRRLRATEWRDPFSRCLLDETRILGCSDSRGKGRLCSPVS